MQSQANKNKHKMTIDLANILDKRTVFAFCLH